MTVKDAKKLLREAQLNNAVRAVLQHHICGPHDCMGRGYYTDHAASCPLSFDQLEEIEKQL
jgi:hypothetical protein